MPVGGTKHRILLVDDHPIVREGLAEMINHERDLQVCAAVDDIPHAMAALERLRPELVVADISLRGANGIELLKNIKARFPGTAVLVLSMHDESLYAVRTLRAGAAGYIMKQEATENVLTAIRRVLAGEIYLSERMEKRMIHQFVGGRAARAGSPFDELSDRELEVFGLIGEGHSTRQIAEELHLSIKTVESHRARIKDKLCLRSGAELVQQAIQCRET